MTLVAVDRDAAAIAGESWLVRAVERLFENAAQAWPLSATRKSLIVLLGLHHPVAPAHVVRLAGWAALSGTSVHAVLVGIGPLLAPPMTGLGWIAVLLVALFAIRRPDVVVNAWADARRQR